MKISELKEGLDALQIPWHGMTERSELEDELDEFHSEWKGSPHAYSRRSRRAKTRMTRRD